MLAHWYGLLLLGGTPTPPEPPVASLGAWGGRVEPIKKKRDKPAIVEEAIPPEVVTRLREEMQAAAVADEAIAKAQARAKQKRNNQVALLMMI